MKISINSCMVLTYVCIPARSSSLRFIPYYMYLILSRNGGLLDVSLMLSLLRLFALYVILALWPPALQYQLPVLLFVCVLFVLFWLFVVVLSCEPKQTQGRGLVYRKLVQAPPLPPSTFITVRPKADSLVVLDVVCGYVLLFLLDIKNRK